MARFSTLAASALLASFASTAAATGWDWGSNSASFTPQNWNPGVENWAMSLSNDPTLSPQDLVEEFSAPAAEPWCGTTIDPSVEDCNAYFASVDWWIVDFQGLESPADIAPGTPILPAPAYCPESCLN